MAFDVRSVPLLKRIFGFGQGKAPRVVGPQGPPKDAYVELSGLMREAAKQSLELGTDRHSIYKDVEEMDQDDIISSALDLLAEDATQVDINTGKTLWVESKNPEIQRIATDLLRDLETEDEIFAITREVAKYGDSFSALLQEKKEDNTPGGIVKLQWRDPKMMWRHEDDLGRLLGFSFGEVACDDKESLSPPWAYVHFRLLGRDRGSKYGTSVIFPVRRLYRKLSMMEQSLAIYRMKRAPDRWIFKIRGLDQLSPDERLETFNRIKQQFRKKMLIDPETGTVRSDIDVYSLDDDLFLDEEAISVEKMDGSSNVGGVLDVDYFRKRLYGGLKIPPDYLGFSEARGGWAAHSPLSYQDIQLARQIRRIQRAVIVGYIRIIQIHLVWCGIDPLLERNEFTVHMSPVSFLDELQRAQLLQTKATTLAIVQDIGKSLGISSDKLLDYMIKIAGLPAFLAVVAREGESSPEQDALSGKVDIIDSKSDLIRSEISKVLRPFTEDQIRNLVYEFVFSPSIRSLSLKNLGPLPPVVQERRRNSNGDGYNVT